MGTVMTAPDPAALVDLKARAFTLGRQLLRETWWEMTSDQAWERLVSQCGDLPRLDAFQVAMDAMNFVMAQSQGDAAALVLEHAEDPENLRDALLEGGR